MLGIQAAIANADKMALIDPLQTPWEFSDGAADQECSNTEDDNCEWYVVVGNTSRTPDLKCASIYSSIDGP